METAVENATVLIHASFAPDGLCVAIEDQPVWAASPNDWFRHLSFHTVNSYRPLQGGRGLFTVTQAQLEELQKQP